MLVIDDLSDEEAIAVALGAAKVELDIIVMQNKRKGVRLKSMEIVIQMIESALYRLERMLDENN